LSTHHYDGMHSIYNAEGAHHLATLLQGSWFFVGVRDC
jgi:hypothetical protein